MDALAGSPISINVKVLLVDTNESNCCRNVQLLGWSTGPGKTFAVRCRSYPSNLLREEAAVLKRIRFAKLFDPCL
ncbi:uncharacterized protein PHALS_13795 [Plasmopara halstedii]|uniref:Uncharacterized protein n=1 Tax=Plasmopara halstedii TaxID=4781 RepID=A0A0P1APX0_PLAHL|nr:uncharacterized protein PHALS_13795 [Plasmopara halstedii]CEG43604.1 hypothetical protein PHALS_13795 [Plasmopara halstedii]|eukprot:XP_024579973.1 hypothetical protein PHALS_13795 [Plasmopara halstedii]